MVSSSSSRSSRPRVVIVGAGFGGIRAARALADRPVDVLLIDRANHHLFRPLLYQVATAGLGPESIAMPIRQLVARRDDNVEVMLDEVCGGDPEAGVVFTSAGRRIPYDYLILGVGGMPNLFGNDHWRPHLFHLGNLRAAMSLKENLLACYEAAAHEEDDARRQSLLTFVVIGGGPTGTELAGALAELGRSVVPKDTRRIRPKDIRVVLVEANDRVLGTFHPELSHAAKGMLEDLGVEVHLGSPVTEVDARGVRLDDGARIESHTVCWASGVAPVPLGKAMGLPVDDDGAILVSADLSVPGHPNVFALGDGTRFVPPGEEAPLPGVAPVAIQMGEHIGGAIKRDLDGDGRRDFHYLDKGMLATVGRSQAVLQMGALRMSGTVAWLVWCVVHVWYLAGFRNRMKVLLDWTWNYVTFRPGARVLTFESGDRFGEPGAGVGVMSRPRPVSAPPVDPTPAPRRGAA
ncbi:MAG: NAD(P)/FAD-dependent oxidoreductase [Myxococcota bacterium]